MVSTNSTVINNNIYRRVVVLVMFLLFSNIIQLPQAQRATAFHYKVVDLSHCRYI